MPRHSYLGERHSYLGERHSYLAGPSRKDPVAEDSARRGRIAAVQIERQERIKRKRSLPWTRKIDTGSLKVDGQPLDIKVQYNERPDIWSDSGWHSTIAQASDGYSARRRLRFPRLNRNKGAIAGVIRHALKEGHDVTAETDGQRSAEFTKIGPLVLGFSEQQALQSVGRFGLGSTLGLRA